MCKILRRSLLLVLLLTAFFAFAPSALAASESTTAITGGTVTIINNYGISDSVTITLSAPAAANVVYWVYLPGPVDKSAQLGSITIKKGATTGKISVATGRLNDFNASGGSVFVVTGTTRDECIYDPVETTPAVDPSKVTLRNNPSGVELLIVDGSIVTKGMTAIAVVNGKLYKGTASKDGVDIQVSLANNMEVDTPVWYTVVAAGCVESGYAKLTLKDVVQTEISSATEFKLFFQGSNTSTSSLLAIGVKPGDTVICTSADGSVRKSATVSGTGNMVTVSGMKLAADSKLFVTITEKGKTESDAKEITVPDEVATTAIKIATVSTTNTLTGSTPAAAATVTVKNVTIGDTVNIYDVKGKFVASGIATYTPSGDPDEVVPTAVDVVISNLDLGTSLTTIYLSVSSPGKGESAWLTFNKVPAAK